MTQADLLSHKTLQQRAKNALKMLFIGDALAMPAHWFYRVSDIDKMFNGGITQFEAAPNYHPSSIMSLHSTQAGGRKQANKKPHKEIVGDVILKGKQAFWGQPNQHYHQGMQAGENTLNAHCTRVLMRSLVKNQAKYDSQLFLKDYIAFMTAYPPQHPDTYAESYHRGFFGNLEQGYPPEKCAAVTHDTASIGGLVTLAPIVFTELMQGLSIEQVQAQCKQHLYLTHPDESLAKIAATYVQLLSDLLTLTPEMSATQRIEEAAQKSGINLPALLKKGMDDRQVVGQFYSSACYITDSWPSVLYLAYKYAHQPKKGLLVNANLGGDNVHRGSVLGVILGLINPNCAQDRFNQLVDKTDIDLELNALLG